MPSRGTSVWYSRARCCGWTAWIRCWEKNLGFPWSPLLSCGGYTMKRRRFGPEQQDDKPENVHRHIGFTEAAAVNATTSTRASRCWLETSARCLSKSCRPTPGLEILAWAETGG